MRQTLTNTGRWRSNGLHCHSCAARCDSVWSQLDEPELDRLDQHKSVQRLDPGEVLYGQGDPCKGLFVVQSGSLALRKFDDSGRSVLLRLVVAGQAVGYRCFFDGGRYRAQAEALEATRVCFLKPTLVTKMFEQNPDVVRGMMQRLARELGDAEDRFLMATRRSVRCRLAHALLRLKDHHGEVDDEGVLTVQLPISRQDLADLLGTRPETIARTTRALEKDGVASFHGRRVVIPDLDLLFDELELDGC
ncbi:MAG: Crp/Fnr family transcriptional regulator [Myxococcales bacterium]|nr:Crp/Fnr family transcriptional regulator [Myxococcales bacterium]